LAGKKALITGGDSGIGRAIAILYALEDADSATLYTPQEEKGAKHTKALVEKKGKTYHLIPGDLKSAQTCKSVVQKPLDILGRVNILVLNHGTQMMKETIDELSEYVPSFLPIPLVLGESRC
jgi:NAD(P)-dependent dehydrogenase (short-subunit alcohol dehydrogenase family)